MPQVSPKGSLPHGWIIRQSKNYPDRVYYFNINTGASVWECPVLDPPRVLSEDENKEVIMNNKSSPVCSKPGVDEVCQSSEKGIKPCTPPTAVVVPVVHNQKGVTPVLSTSKKRKRKKSKGKSKESKVSELKKEDKKTEKRISPLNKYNSEETILHGKEDTSPASQKVELQIEENAKSSSSENNIKDVEMHDVSMDLELLDKKETVIDTTACYYIVVDTNVLIREIHLISELKDTPLDGCGPPHIFIPWVVIEELDKLKNQRNAKGTYRAASEAIRYLNSVLGKHPRFHGQSPAEAEEWAKAYSKCNDDKILECCIALQDKMPVEKIILLTNDKNLVNKALICKINVHNFESMMKKVKPDTIFNYEEIKMNKKMKKEKNNEELQSALVSSDTIKERILQTKRNICKSQIHSIMSNARLLLKDVLCKFLKEEMFEAYGDVWLNFKVDVNLLKGILEGIKRYWIAVFSIFFSEKDKRNFELLLEKASRPEGFLGDKDESLVILSAIEDVFIQIQRRRPKLKVPVEQIQDYRVACVNAFAVYCEVDSSIRTAEETTIRTLLDLNWTAINQLCGIILDYYKVPHNFIYEKTNQTLPEFEVRRIMVILYPSVQQFKSLLQSINRGIQNSKPIKSLIKRFSTALIEFIPSLGLPYEPVSHLFFNEKAMEKFFTCPQNREMIEVGIEQIENFYSKLDEVLRLMLLPHLRNESPDPENMICD